MQNLDDLQFESQRKYDLASKKELASLNYSILSPKYENKAPRPLKAL
jgi:hypothetical protein